MPTNRFPRTARVRSGADFDRIFKHGRRVALPVLALHWHADPAEPVEGAPVAPAVDAQPRPSRLGLAVSRKVDPHAVGRNRIKRVLRDSFRHHRGLLAGGDFVVVARVGASRCTGDELRRAFLSLLVRAGALPASAAPVTMPTAAPSSHLPSSEPASAPRVG